MRNWIFGIGTVSLIAAPVFAQENAPTQVAENWQKIENCAQFSAPENRHACVDQVMRDAGLLTVAAETAEQEESFGQRAPQREARVEETAPEVTAPPEVNSIASSIAFARFVGRNKLLVVTESGAVWRQTSDETFRRVPSVGVDFEASETSLGGFRCRIGRSTVYRCIRLD